ncbi:tail fiber assembly protein [Erwinia sp. S59]|uniref:tail fiber assembly protein n=1 Tax=Erwinia sp. S59 TaxID=2769340 RepID=UPI001909F369|nr:tail fiber assembly protein [Erwinia sp. S59]MBK0089465.1 tail fiber assembly protein [Erwinia sp. S59]
MFYSDEAGFTTEQVSEGQVEISDKAWQALIIGQASGKVIASDSKGKPVLTDPPEPTAEQQVIIAQQKRDALLSVAEQAISIWKTKLLMGRALTDDETLGLNNWMDYIDLLSALDVSTAPDIDWPVTPA